MLLVARPRPAEAEETAAETPIPSFVKAPAVVPALGVRLALFAPQPLKAEARLFAPSPAEIRLSRGAKTAIIVAAIVVGVLLVVGVVAVTRPGHL